MPNYTKKSLSKRNEPVNSLSDPRSSHLRHAYHEVLKDDQGKKIDRKVQQHKHTLGMLPGTFFSSDS